MRLRACLGVLLLAAGGCAELPKKVRVEIDGRSVQYEEKPKRQGDDQR